MSEGDASQAGFDHVTNKDMDNSYISGEGVAPHRRNQVIQQPQMMQQMHAQQLPHQVPQQ